MPESRGSPHLRELKALRRELIRGGVSSGLVTRTIAELYDHYEDLEVEALEAGCNAEEASTEAIGRLGSGHALAEDMLRYPEFRSWAFRWPWVPAVLRQLVILTSLASVPVLVVVSRGPVIVRWCVSAGLRDVADGWPAVVIGADVSRRPAFLAFPIPPSQGLAGVRRNLFLRRVVPVLTKRSSGAFVAPGRVDVHMP